MNALKVPQAALVSPITQSAPKRSNKINKHHAQFHENTTELSKTLNYPNIVKNYEEVAIVEWALANCKEIDFRAIRRQVYGGQKILFNDLKRGDIVILCTSHSVYGQSSRRYLYWGKTSVDSDQRLVFLTLVTCEGNGVEKSLYWFLKHVSYKFQSGRRVASKAFVSWTQAVVVKPKHDYIVGIRERLGATSRDLNGLVKFMEHSLNSHAELISYLSTLNHTTTSYPDAQKRGDTYCKIRDSLRTLTSKVCTEPCGVRALQGELGKYPKDEKWCTKYFPVDSGSQGFKPNSRKCQPPKDFCELMTGQVARFCASNHKMIGN
ncbi:hypothetical protein FPOAC2_05026 [Fusarium poae]